MASPEDEEIDEAYKVVLKNYYQLSHEGRRSEGPWFLEKHNLARSLLREVQKTSNSDRKVFCREVAKLLVNYKRQEHDYILRRIALLKENIAVLETIDKVKDYPNLNHNTTIEFKVKQAESTNGLLKVLILIDYNIYQLVEGENLTCIIDVSRNVMARFVLDEDNRQEFGREEIDIGKTINEYYIMNGIENPEIKFKIAKRGLGYKVAMTFKVKLSKDERLRILEEKAKIFEFQLNEKNESMDIYADLQDTMQVKYDSDHNEFVSLLPKRESCCSECIAF
jgi:hypothetical protein